MSDDSMTRFAKLNDANYAAWSIMMEAELIRKSLWTDIVELIVDADGKDTATIATELATKKLKRKADKMAQARAEMILRVEPGQLAHMTAKDPMEIWETLMNVHRGRGFATKLALKRKFLTSKKGRNQPMQGWIGEIRAQAFEMKMAGISVDDDDIILALTLGLPPSYDNIIISLDSTAPNDLTVDYVITRLLNEETRQTGNRSRPSPSSNHSVEDEAVAVTPIRRRQLSEITCFFCLEKGHYRADCEKRKAWERSQAAGGAMGAEDDDDSDIAF